LVDLPLLCIRSQGFCILIITSITLKTNPPMKTIKTVVLACLLFHVDVARAQFQYWYTTDDYDWPRALAMDSQDGYFITGSTLFFYPWHPFITRVDKTGKLLWSNTYPLPGIDDHFSDIIMIPNGADRVVAVGSADGDPNFWTSSDDYLLITAGDGTVLQAKRFYTDETDGAVHIEPTTNPFFGPGYIIAGNTYHNLTTSERDVHVVLTNGGGGMMGSRIFLHKLNQTAHWITPTSDNGYILLAETQLTGSCDNDNANVLVVKLNSSLNVVWDRTFDIRPEKGYSEDVPSVVKEDANGEIHVVGTSAVYIDSTYDHRESFQLHLRSDGSLLWAKLYRPKSYPSAQTVSLINNVTLNDGSPGYVLGGRAFDPFHALLFQTNDKGDVTWARTYPADYPLSTTYAEDLTENKLKGYSFTGRRLDYSPPSSYDIHLVETDANGKTGQPCETEIEIAEYKPEVCVDELGLKKTLDMRERQVSPVVQPLELVTYNCKEEQVSAASQLQGSISPNPARTSINISGFAQGGEVLIYDLQGNLKIKTTVGENDPVDIASLPEGLYILKVVDTTGGTQEFRFMKN
jgi:hypothetical protein